MPLSLFSKLQKEVCLFFSLYSVYGIVNHLKGIETQKGWITATLLKETALSTLFILSEIFLG